MSTSENSRTQAGPEMLDFYTLRDEIARHYNPVGQLEVMLVTQIVQAWLCLQHAYETQRRYFQAHDVLEAIAKQFQEYKAVNREVVNCDRAWRHAILYLEKTQRQRRRDSQEPCPRPRAIPSPPRSIHAAVEQPRPVTEPRTPVSKMMPDSLPIPTTCGGPAPAVLCPAQGPPSTRLTP